MTRKTLERQNEWLKILRSLNWMTLIIRLSLNYNKLLNGNFSTSPRCLKCGKNVEMKNVFKMWKISCWIIRKLHKSNRNIGEKNWRSDNWPSACFCWKSHPLTSQKCGINSTVTSPGLETLPQINEIGDKDKKMIK